MSPICTALKIISTIESISFILYVYYCHLNHLFCQILVGTPSTSTSTGVVQVPQVLPSPSSIHFTTLNTCTRPLPHMMMIIGEKIFT
mgnify:CR=1 FL=1